MKMTKKFIQTIFQISFLGVFIFFAYTGKLKLWLVLFAVSVALTPLLGRIYCGYMCPMNTGMKLTDSIARKLNLRTTRIPRILTGNTLPWIVLVMSIMIMAGSRRVLHKEFPVMIVLIFMAMLLTLRYEEWVVHNHFCPFGAILKLVGKKSFFRTQVDKTQCIGCKKCEKVCNSQAIKVCKDTKKAEVNVSLCHECQLCADICPKKAIQYEISK